MEMARQVKLLLRRNIALRLRQPVILTLELLWPVAIFLVVMVARHAIPPVPQPTCHYKAWALPSSGVVPFVQSLICNIDECQNETEYEDIPSYRGSSVRELVANTMPLIMDQNITELVSALPKGMRLMRAAVDALSGPDLSALLGDGFPIQNLVRDSNQTKELLRGINMTSEDVELILNSSIQLPQILELMSQNNFCDIDEDDAEPNFECFWKLRKHLCTVDEEVRKDFFRQLKNQLDVKSIVQTMGVAMTELGRLDIGEILGNIAGLLINFQTSTFFHEDALKIVSTFLKEVRLDQLDTEVVPLVIDDLEPFYKESEWAPLIYALKHIKIPPSVSKKYDRFETPESSVHIWKSSTSETFTKTGILTVDGDNGIKANNASNVVQSILGVLQTGADVLKFLPAQTSQQVQRGMKYFTFLVDTADDLEKSLKTDNSSKFVDTLSDVLGALFLNVADEAQVSTSRKAEGTFCDVNAFRKIISPSEWTNFSELQHYICQISKLTKKTDGSSKVGESSESWASSIAKLQKLFDAKRHSDIHRNVLQWNNETQPLILDEGTLSITPSSFKYKANVNDIITTFECLIQEFQGISNNSVNETHAMSMTQVAGQLINEQERFILFTLSKLKSTLNIMKQNRFFMGHNNNTNADSILEHLYKIVSVTGGESLHNLPWATGELLRLLPALITYGSGLITNTTVLRNDIPSIVSTFIENLESSIWKSISPKMVEDFAMKNSSKYFCVDTEALEVTQLHWKWILCEDSTPSFKISLPKESIWKKAKGGTPSNLNINTGANFNTQDFTRILLHMSNGLGFMTKVVSQLSKPIDNCHATCGSNDTMLNKMCFLGRLQNVKNSLFQVSHNEREDFLPDENSDILKQLQALIHVDEDVASNYNTFMEVVHASAENNYTDWKDIVQLLVSGFRFLDSFDGKEHKLKPILHVTNSLISLLKNRVSDAAQSRASPMVEIQNVFPDSPLTQEVVKGFLPLLPEVMSTFFWTALAPERMLNLVIESKKNISVIISVLCNTSLTEYVYNPTLTPEDFENLREALCRHEYYDVFEEVFQDPDIQEIAFEASSTDEVSWDDMHENILEIVSLLQDLIAVRKVDMNSFPPLEKFQKMATNIHAQIMNPSVALYILNNELFYGFCNGSSRNRPILSKLSLTEDEEKNLNRTLCSMSTELFARQVVMKLNKVFRNSAVTLVNETKSVNMDLVFQNIWPELSNVPEINDIVKLALGVNLKDNVAIANTSTGIVDAFFESRIANATKRSFDLVDNVFNGSLSKTISGSPFPELLQDILAFVQLSDRVKGDKTFTSGSDQVLNVIPQKGPEQRRLESYIQALASFFSEDNAKKLKDFCKTKIRNDNVILKMFCFKPPNNWSNSEIINSPKNITSLWIQIDEALTEEMKNATQVLYLQKRKKEFLQSLNEILVSSIRFAKGSNTRMPSFYFEMMRALVRSLEDSKNATLPGINCLPESSKMAIVDSTRKLLGAIPGTEFLTCKLSNKNISGFYSWISRSSDLKNALVKVANGTKLGHKCDSSREWLFQIIDDMEGFYKKISKKITKDELSRTKNCLTNIVNSPLISSLRKHVNVVQQSAKFLSTLNATSGHIKGFSEHMFEKISQHLPGFFKLSDVVSKNSLPPLLKNDEDLEKTLLDTSINFNWVIRQGFSSNALHNKICSSNNSPSQDRLFSYSSQASRKSITKLEKSLCFGHTIEDLLNSLNQTAIKQKVRETQEKEFFSGLWLQELGKSSEVLIDVGSYLVTSLIEIQVQNLYDVLQLFSKPHIIQNVVDSFQRLIGVLDPVFPESSLVETLEQIMEGLKAFKSLSKLANFSFTYSVEEVFGLEARKVLLNELKMDPLFAAAFLKTEVNLKQVVTEKNNRVSFCKNSSDISVLCKLSSNQKTALSPERLQDLVFQKFLISIGTLGMEGVLREAQVDLKEAGRTLEVLSSAPIVVSKLTNHLQSVTTLMHPEVKELFHELDQGAEWLATPEALSTGGKILCGKPLTSLSRKFRLLSPEDTENKIEQRELLRLPTDFCRHGYKEIMKMRGGAILWGFLKPLFRGKILFAPKSYTPAYIIISKLNETFNILEDHVRFIKSAAEGSTGLHYLQRKNETLQSVQRLLSSKTVSKLLGSPSWGSSLSWLESPSTSSQSLLHLIELVGNVTECISLDRFLGFDTEEELEAAAATLHDRREFIAAIVFMDDKKFLAKRWSDRDHKHQLPKEVKYKIRMDIDNVPTTEYIKYRWWRPYPYDDFFEDLRYLRGFIQLQDIIDSAIIDLQSGSQGTGLVKKYLQQFPYPCHQGDKFGTLLKGSMPAVMTISWVFIVAFIVRERVLGRELELDETLSVMGLKRSAGWIAWFLTGFCILLVSVVGIVAVLKWGGITPNSDPVVLFLFVADFAILLIAYCQLMSTFFSRASTAALLSVLLYVLSFFPFLLFVTWELDFLYWQKLLSCVLVSTSFCFGCLYLNRYEDQGQGVHWSNLWKSPVAEDRMNFGTTLVAMVLCSSLYFITSWYVSRIISGYKARKPLAWYVMLTPTSNKEKALQPMDLKIDPKSKVDSNKKVDNTKNVNRTVGISIQGVTALYTKRGSSKWHALAGLNLDLHENHITALLGHNGAGKTTTIKILTGRLLPTAGKVTLYGFSVPEQLSEARKLIGFCPQNNTLYDKLTVKEHLNLFARLKGILHAKNVKKDVDEMIERLNLMDKQNECTETLSGGQRRRLCVGIAFVGGSKVVILDEPTSSVDPVARRSIWDLILSYKKDRTILFTTHHLDEADILSDRVAILHKGRMLCSGSPLELKSRFGSGYRLSLLPTSEKPENEEHDSGKASSYNEEPVNVDCDGVMEFIQSYVPDATLLENDGSQLVVSLPAEPLTVKPLSEFFAHLQKCLHLWGFHTCSISSATLEEVFLTLCRLEDAKAAHNSDKCNDISPFRVSKPTEQFIEKNNGCCKKFDSSLVIEMKEPPSKGFTFSTAHLKCSQLQSLIKKRFWHTKRNWKALTSSIVMPCVFIALAMGLAVGRPQKSPDPSIELTPSLYSSTNNRGVSFFSFEDSKHGLGDILLGILDTNKTQKETCSLSHENCFFSWDDTSETANLPLGRCLCEADCPEISTTLVSAIPSRDQILYNMTNMNIPRYLLTTYLHFNEKRYGGWSILEEKQQELSAKVWFENSGYHSSPAYLNTFNNAILKKEAGAHFNIRTFSHPLRLSVEQLGRETLLQRLGEVGISFVFLIGLSLVPCTFAVYIVGERESEQKRLQMVTGALSPFLYWSAAFIWDMFIVLLTSMIAAVIVSSFALPAFYQRENFRAVYTLTFLYGWATTPLTYLGCRFFREGSLAFMVIFTSHLFVGLVIMLSLVSLRMISISKDVAATLELLQRVSLAFPQYSLVGGLTDLNENQIRTEIFEQFGQDAYVSPFSWSSLGPNFVSLFVQGVVFFFITVLLEVLPVRHWCQRLWLGKQLSKQKVEVANEDDADASLLQIKNISQVYHTKAGYRYAVDNLTLTIPEGECFGLVGANGAGKTTLFRLLIGEIQPTSGKIISVGLRSKQSKRHRFLGYCPQKDALDGLLTPRQHLEVYAGLRGIPRSEISKVVESSLQSVELLVHANRPVYTLSGGTKRKLCTAIAVLGQPELILLDEPTSGMDPATRRLVWKCILRVTEMKKSVILTSHSIEDCDVLSSRLGIMVNGTIACLDSPLKLKARLGRGYTLSFRISDGKEDWSSLLNFITREIPSAHLQIHSGRRIELALPDENIPLSNLFCKLEECAKKFGIEDLAIDPTTLDQVFVNFVRQQSDSVQKRKEECESNRIAQTSELFPEMCSTKL